MSYNAITTPIESNTRSSSNLSIERNVNTEQTKGYNNDNDSKSKQVQENIKMKQKLYQYEYIIKTQQEQLREYHDLLHKYEVQSLNCELLQLRLQDHLLTTNLNQTNEPELNQNQSVPVDHTDEYTNNHDHGHDGANEASLSESAFASESESASESASASEESRRNADLVNEVMRLTLELAQSRSQSDSQQLQIREITAERDALQDEVKSTRDKNKNNTRKIMRGRALLKRIGQTSSRIFRFDDEL